MATWWNLHDQCFHFFQPSSQNELFFETIINMVSYKNHWSIKSFSWSTIYYVDTIANQSFGKLFLAMLKLIASSIYDFSRPKKYLLTFHIILSFSVLSFRSKSPKISSRFKFWNLRHLILLIPTALPNYVLSKMFSRKCQVSM